MSPTPILDRQQPAPAMPPANRKWSLAIGAALGLSVVLLSGRYQFGDPLLVLAFMAPAMYLLVLFHELGHVAAGLLVGFEFRRVLVGPCTFTHEPTGYRLRFHGGRWFGGGLTLMVPRSPDDLRQKFRLFVAGGPVVTLLLFVPAILFPWGAVGGALLLTNLMLAASCLIPMETRGYYTDAKIVGILSREGPEADRLAAVLYVMTLDGRGVLPKDWPPEVIGKLAAPGGRAYRAGARVFLHIHARYTAPDAELANALEQVLSVANELSGSFRQAYFSEAAFFQAVTNRNVERARAWLDDARTVKGAIAQKGWDEAALTAIAYGAGNDEEFQTHLKCALEYLDRQPGPSGSLTAFRSRLLALAATVPAPSTHLPTQ
jgi:hypothetical protein